MCLSSSIQKTDALIVTHFLSLWSRFKELLPSKGLAQCLPNVRDTASGPTNAVVSPVVLGQGFMGTAAAVFPTRSYPVGLKLPALAFQWKRVDHSSCLPGVGCW